MAGGRKINDHSAWMGKPGKGSAMPMETKMKQLSSVVGAGSEMDYEDNDEKIKAQQSLGVSKAKSHAQKPLHRN